MSELVLRGSPDGEGSENNDSRISAETVCFKNSSIDLVSWGLVSERREEKKEGIINLHS
jgi:hypothetical protein